MPSEDAMLDEPGVAQNGNCGIFGGGIGRVSSRPPG
jgi:hypothetical protein